jgi:two-component system, chemotaxis family, chemotaxis protein CheY
MQAMVIDDSRAMRTLLQRFLKQLGFEVCEATNGREALDRLQAGPSPDLALVDWNMPEMNGYELVLALRARPEFAGLRLVMVTTETEASQVERALQAGADEYVMKPFTPEVLRDKLALLGLEA